MSKVNISFNNHIYSIDESVLSSVRSELASQFSAMSDSNNSTIMFMGTAYDISNDILRTARNTIQASLNEELNGSLSDNGLEVSIGGVNYFVKSSVVADVLPDLHASFHKLAAVAVELASSLLDEGLLDEFILD